MTDGLLKGTPKNHILIVSFEFQSCFFTISTNRYYCKVYPQAMGLFSFFKIESRLLGCVELESSSSEKDPKKRVSLSNVARCLHFSMKTMTGGIEKEEQKGREGALTRKHPHWSVWPGRVSTSCCRWCLFSACLYARVWVRVSSSS